MAKSPSVSLIEQDVKTYTNTSSNTTVAVVGYATKGPIGEAKKVSSFKEFRQKFGYPTTLGFSSLAVQRIFNKGNSLIFYRVAETEGAESAISSKVLVKNSVDALDSYIEFSRTTDVLYGASNYTNGVEYSFKISDKNFYMKSPSSGRWSISDMLDQMSSQVAATSGYQEFTDKSLANLSYTSYFFKVTVDGKVVANGLNSNSNLMIDVTSADDLESVSTKIKNALSGGSRAYSFFAFSSPVASLTAALGLTSTKYNFKIKTVENEAFSTIVISNVTTNTTLNDIASKINTELTRRSIAVVCIPDVYGLYFFSKVNGSSSYARVENGSDLTSVSKGVDLFLNGPALQGSTQNTIFGNDGVSTSVAAVTIDNYTKRIKITSASTGASSTVAIASATLSSSIPNHDLTDSNALNIEAARNGQASINVAIERNTTTKKIRVSAVDTASALSSTFIEGGTAVGALDFLTLMPVDASVTGHVGTSTATTDVIIWTSKETGSSTNKISVVKSSTVNPTDNSTVYTIKVYYDGELKETFSNVSMVKTDSSYFVNKINDEVENDGSEWVSVEVINNGGSDTITFVDGTYQLGVADDDSAIAYSTTMDVDAYDAYDYVVGTDGIPENGGEELFVAALASDSDLANKDVFDYHVLLTPDNNEEAVQSAAITLAESRKDFLYLVDPPFGLSYDQVKSWHNGDGYGRYTAVSSSYSAIYWPWLKTYDSYSKKYVWTPPSVFMAEKLLEVDNVYKPWAAPAGETRGKIVADDSEFSPSFAEREEIYGDYNCVNPIVDFSSKGLIVYGQKTASREDVATNRINVRRMVIYAKKLIKKALDAMLFEPNNTDSWQKATTLVNSILETIRQGGGISEYKTTIDATTNTADIVAQNMMVGTVKIVPTGTIEVVELSINVYASGSTIE